MRSILGQFAWWTAALTTATIQATNVTLSPAAIGFKSDNTAFIYGSSIRLVSNDGSAAGGGFRTFAVDRSLPLEQKSHAKTGRSKISTLR